MRRPWRRRERGQGRCACGARGRRHAGWSARKWPPRLSRRSSAAPAIRRAATRAGARPWAASRPSMTSEQRGQARRVAHDAGVAAHGRAQLLQGGGGQASGASDGQERRGGGVRLVAAAQAGAPAEGGGLQQGVGGQAVGAVHAGGGAFADGEQARQAGAAVQRRRRSRPCGSAPPGPPGSAARAGRSRRPWQAAKTAGKCSGKSGPTACARIEEGAAPGGDGGVDGAGDDVAGGQIGPGGAPRQGAPSRSIRRAPSPRRASVARGAGSAPTSMRGGVELDELGVERSRRRPARPAPGPRRAAAAGLVVTA